jgi:uncharacterized protein (TIGR03435 family)
MAIRTNVFNRSSMASFVRGCTLCAASTFSLGISVLPLQSALAQAAATEKMNIDDTWQGTLHAEKDLRSVLKIEKASDGSLKSSFYSIDQGGRPIPVKQTAFAGGELRVNVEVIDGTYVGKMSPDGTTITGEWKQGDTTLPLILLRATPETAWAIPEPPKKLPPMAADADPGFDVATIKLTPTDFRGKGFGGPPGTFNTRGTTLNDLIMYAYRVHTRQIIGAPDWWDTVRFDITAKPDTPGQPSEKQNEMMMQKLLASRFGLKFHLDNREISAYVLTVAKGGPKLDKSEANPDDGIGFNFRGLGELFYRNITMPEFASWMQTVLDRPVVDRTELQGRFDGKLKWNPDETQFAIFGPPPHPSTAADAPPDLYKAIQEQIGLKLDAAKTAVPVMVLDHVEKPSDN